MNKIKCACCRRKRLPENFWLYKKPGTKFLYNKKFIHYHTCRDCCLNKINPHDVNTLLPLLQEMNIPYFKDIYEEYLNSSNPVGKYLARMRLGNLYDLEYKDTERLNEGARR
jgi:hypothetical protein